MTNEFKPSKILKLIFDQNLEMFATVEASTVDVCDRGSYEPLLLGVRAIESYNNFNGVPVESWLRDRLTSLKNGPIISIRFGREYSPVLFFTIANALVEGKELREIKANERRNIALSLIKNAKRLLTPDSAEIVFPGVVRLWWD